MQQMRFLATAVLLAASLATSAAWADEPAATAPSKADTSHKNTSQRKDSSAAKKAEARKTAANTPSKERPDCLKSTGSRIPARPGECLSEPGHSWSQEDVQSTGKPTAGGALRQMDPLLH